MKSIKHHLIAWAMIGIFAGCTTTQQNTIKDALNEWIKKQNDPAITNEVPVIVDAPDIEPEEKEEPNTTDDWRTWKDAPDTLVAGAPYGKDSYGNFKYKNAVPSGKYKPQTTLWLLPLGTRIEDLGFIGEIDNAGNIVQWAQLTGYHNNRVKARIRVKKSGNWLKAYNKDNSKLYYKMQIVDKDVRQE